MEIKNPIYDQCICCFEENLISENSLLNCKADPFHFVCEDCFKKSKRIKCFYCNPLNNKINIDINELESITDDDLNLPNDENFIDNYIFIFIFSVFYYSLFIIIFAFLFSILWLSFK
tara:strand:+ start:641 stop:991 length:351 start_codon:yes stop_codon:yes gene_type:complete